MSIVDFGQVLPGAAKHRYEAWRQKLTHIPAQALEGVSLNVAFPAPAYAKLIADGMDSQIVAAVRALRETLGQAVKGNSRRPRSQEVALHRTLAVGLLDETITVAAALDHLPLHRAWTSKATLQQIIDFYCAHGHDVSFWQAKKGSPNTKRARRRKLEVYIVRLTRQYFVGARVGGTILELKYFNSLSEARAAIELEAADLYARLEQALEIPAFRSDRNAERQGIEWRTSALPVDATQFAAKLPFRGVQFGNYVEKRRRQEDLDYAYDACHDLAFTLNIPLTSLTFHGSLGLAFGARGRGGKHSSSAHFEPCGFNINITKVNGAGSFAHEWWHALDNYVGRYLGQPHDFATELNDCRRVNGKAEQPLAREFSALLSAIGQTGLSKRSKCLDRKRSKPYFGLVEEVSARAFEGWVRYCLEQKSHVNNWLVNLIDPSSFFVGNRADVAPCDSDYPYPLPEEMPVIAKAFEHLFRAEGPLVTHLRKQGGLPDLSAA